MTNGRKADTRPQLSGMQFDSEHYIESFLVLEKETGTGMSSTKSECQKRNFLWKC